MCWELTFFPIVRFATIVCWSLSRQQREPSTREFLDLLIDPASIILTEKFAQRFGLATGSQIRLTLGDRPQNFVVRGLLRNEGPARAMDGNLVLMDIAAAQLALNRLGWIDRLELLPADGDIVGGPAR